MIYMYTYFSEVKFHPDQPDHIFTCSQVYNLYNSSAFFMAWGNSEKLFLGVGSWFTSNKIAISLLRSITFFYTNLGSTSIYFLLSYPWMSIEIRQKKR